MDSALPWAGYLVSGWLVVSEAEDGGPSVEKSDISETLFLELRSIVLFGQLRIYFATVDTAYSATVRFEDLVQNLNLGPI